MTMPSTDIAFSPAVKSVQERRGSRGAYARLEQNGGWDTKIDAVLKFIAGMRSFYLATASKDGQPYVQHRGGPPGVLRVIMAIRSPSPDRLMQSRAVRRFTGQRGFFSSYIPTLASEAGGRGCPLMALFGHPTCTDECPPTGRYVG